MHLVQGVEHEEQQRAARGGDAVLLARRVDLVLRLLGLGHLDHDLVRHALGLLERLDEHHILGQVALGVGKLRQQRVLQLLELNGELVVLHDERRLGLLQVGALLVHHQREQLVLQTVLRHGEVDERRLRLDLGRVVRVGHLRVQEQLEVGVVLHVLVSHLDVQRAPLLVRRASHRWHEHRVDALAHVLDEHARAVLDRLLHDVRGFRRAHAHDLQVVLRLALLDPRDALQLRVAHQRPALGVAGDGAVLDGRAVRGQTLADPPRDRRGVHQNLQHVDALRHRNPVLDDVLLERRHELVAELRGERTGVRHERGGEQAVAHEHAGVDLELRDGVLPLLAGRGERVHQSVRQPELYVELRLLVDGAVLLHLGFVELALEVGDERVQVRHFLLHSRELGVRLVELRVRLRELLALRLDHRDDVKVLDDVDGELAQAGGGARLVVNRVAVEVLQLEVRAARVNRLLGNLTVVNLLLEPLEGVHELVNVAHHLRRRVPGLILGVVLQQNDDHRRDVVHARGGLLQRLGLAEVLLVQGVERGERLVHQRLRRVEVSLHGDLLRRHLRGDHRALVRLHLRGVVLHGGGRLLDVHLGGERAGALHLLGNLHGFHLRLRDEHVDVLLRLHELVQAVGEAIDVGLRRAALIQQQRLVQLDELQERLRCGVVEPALLLEELLRHLRHERKRERHELHHRRAHVARAEVRLPEETLRDAEKRLLRPRLEPVDHRGVDHRQETLRASAELLAHGRAREHHVQVRAHLVDEKLPNRLARVGQARCLRLASDGVDDVIDVLGREQVGDLAGGQQVVDEYHELLVRDL